MKINNEMNDFAKAGASSFSTSERRGRRFRDVTTDTPITPDVDAAAANAETVDKGLYARGGYVAARASGKRDYPKGKR